MDAMLTTFIAEARENLETASRCFLELEKHPDDPELLNDLFRAIHTIKGASGLFDIPPFTQVVHAAEDVLDAVRSGQLSLTSEHVDLFLDTMDRVSIWLDDLEASGALGEGAEAIGQSLSRDLRALLAAPAEESGATPAVAGPSASTGEAEAEPPAWLSRVADDLRLQLFRRAQAEPLFLVAVDYRPDPQCFFSGDDPLHTVRTLPGMVWFGVQSRDPWPPPEELDPYRCNLAFQALAFGDPEEVHHHLRYVSDQVWVVTLAPDALIFPAGEKGDNEPFAPFLREAPALLARGDWEDLRVRLAALLEIAGPDLWQTSVLRWMAVLLERDPPDRTWLGALLAALETGTFTRPDASEDLSPLPPGEVGEPPEMVGTPREDSLSSRAWQALLEALAVQKRILSMPCPDHLRSGRIASVATVVRRLLENLGLPVEELEQALAAARSQDSPEPLAVYLDRLELPQRQSSPVAVSPKPAQPETPRPKPPERSAAVEALSSPSKTLKVDQARVDALMDLVGELIVAKNALPFLARRAEDDFGVRALAKEIKAQYAVIDRLAEALQGAVMQIRMVPVSHVFQRFPRLVRDLSRKLGKRVRLVLEGEETEADKNVVESLADPLIHLVRNSLDHGLEPPEEREAAGKPAEGTLVLRAIPRDDQVVIEVCDDGRGIDPEVIKRKAYQKGIIDEQRLDTISDQEALQLIFAPGFSTAEQVSDLSGRGVGMDVVRSVVSQASGSVTVESEKGKGTTIRLALPLSMAVTRVMMIEVAGQCYGIAMEDVVETVRLPCDRIRRIKHREAVVLRDRLIPLLYLRRLLGLVPLAELPEEMALLVLNLEGEEVGLIIDDFHEGIDIILKPLEGVMAAYRCYSGAALLGDGRVLLVLNVRELLPCR